MKAVTRRLPDADPAAAVASFASGHYADYLVKAGLPVPAWAWVNAVARGSSLFVASLALLGGDPPELGEREDQLRPWYRARKTMALVVAERVNSLGCDLAHLQRGALQGLELELAATGDLIERGPIETTALVSDAIDALHEGSPPDACYWD